MSKSVAAIICAAGPGTRFGGKRKKQFVDVAGRAVFVRSVELFSNRNDVKQILLGISKEDEEIVNVKWGPNLKFFNVHIFFGGDCRARTVQNGLQLVKDDMDLVAVHDACRCCVTAELIDKVVTAAGKSGAAIPVCPVAATLKDVRDGKIVRTVDRSTLYEAQTPQIFETSLLKKAFEQLDSKDADKASDDALLVEQLGHEITIVESDSSNIKITKRSDVPVAEAIIKSRPKPKPEGPVGPYIEAQW